MPGVSSGHSYEATISARSSAPSQFKFATKITHHNQRLDQNSQVDDKVEQRASQVQDVRVHTILLNPEGRFPQSRGAIPADEDCGEGVSNRPGNGQANESPIGAVEACDRGPRVEQAA